MITPRQRDVLLWVAKFIATHRYSPSYQEVADGVGLFQKGPTYRLVDQLESRGMIKRTKRTARSFALTTKGDKLIKGFQQEDTGNERTSITPEHQENLD
jgi:SOS-response transcriptional repressor LexA